MLPFRSEIRNSPKKQTIKIFLTNPSLDVEVKTHLESFNEIELIEIRKSVERNRVDENLTIFLKENIDINTMKKTIEDSLLRYFEEN